MRYTTTLLCGVLPSVMCGLAFAQSNIPPEAQRHVDAARAAAAASPSPQMADTCVRAPAASGEERVRDRSTGAPPVKLFDNVYYVGLTGVGTLVIKTNAGLILIDSLYNKSNIENVLIPGFKKLGLDPKDIKYILVTHGHGDHYGGAQYLRGLYGPHIYMADVDYALPPPKGSSSEWGPKPERDGILTDGGKVTLGDETVTFVAAPGHTPGTTAMIFPVKDHGVPHVAAVWQSPGLATSADKLAKVAAAMHVDVMLGTHFTDGLKKAEAMAKAPPGAKNPFIIGEASYQAYLKVISECAQASDIVNRATPQKTPKP